jgi:CubicO group peptidase (beta-lactamase class C family)
VTDDNPFAAGGEAGASATTTLARWRVGRLGLPALLTMLLACGPPGLGHGVWVSNVSSSAGTSSLDPSSFEDPFTDSLSTGNPTNGDPFTGNTEQYVLAFEHTRGFISGTMHHLISGKQVRQWGFAGTRKGSGELELSWGANNSMTATVDLELGEIEAAAVLANGATFDGLFLRREASEIPGLEALAEMPYQLRPPAPGSGWDVAEPESVGLSPRHLEATVRAVARGDAGLLHSLLIVRNGALVLEEYFHGFQREDLHETQSVTKSVASLVVGLAHDRGSLSDLGTPVLEWFPEFSATAQPKWEKVSLEHLLTMRAGLDWEPKEVTKAWPGGPALFEEIFSRHVAHEPGTRFLYNNADVELLGGIVLRATGIQADELASQALFAPLGITTWNWDRGKREGYPSLSGALHLRPLDMAKIGQLVLDGGRWQGEQVISEEWVAESTAPSVNVAGGSQGYGYLWWRLSAPLDAGPYPVLNASGWGSQIIHIVPALNTVVVTTGGNHFTSKAFAIDDVLLRKLVPGIER